MKALRIVGIAILSLFIFSCASTPTTDSFPENIQENESTVAEDIENVTEINETETLEEELEIEVQEQDDIQTEEENPIEEVEEKELEVNSEETDILHQELEEIIEPEVIELEPPLEEILEEEPELESEIIPDAEKEIQELPPVETILEDTKTDSSVPEIQPETENQEKIEEVVDVVTEVEDVISADEEVNVIADDSDDVVCLDGDDTTEVDTKKNDEVIIPSRSVKIKLMEYVDVTYPGNGWIFMGLTDNSKDLTYNGRQIGTENTKFSLQAKSAGKKILHFYKNDALTGQFIDDYVEVIVLSEKGSPKTHTAAPEYKTPLPKNKTKTLEITNETEEKKTSVETANEITTQPTPVIQETQKEEKTENKKVEPSKTETKVTTPVSQKQNETPIQEIASESVDTEKLFLEAKQAFDSKNYKIAENKLNQFLEYSNSKRDEALYLLGQLYEVPGENQNIQLALNSYTTLITNYPASKFWDNANKRIIYLKRFYMEGR